MKIACTWSTVLFLLLAVFLLFFYRGADLVAVEGAKRRSSWLEWAKERLGQEVGIQQELAKETMNRMVDVKRDFATEVVEEAIDGLVGDDGGGAGGAYFGRDKLDAWMEWGKEKLKHVVEEQSEAAKDWFSNSLDAAHDFVKSIVQEMSSGNSVAPNLHDLSSIFMLIFSFSTSLDAAHDFVKSIVQEMSSVDDNGGGEEDKESESNGGGLSKPKRSSLSRGGAMKDEL